MSAFPPGIKGPAAKEMLNKLWDRVSSVFALTDGATITVDIAQDERVFDVTLGGNRTINLAGTDSDGNAVALGNAALAAIDGKQLLLRVKQDATGTRVPVLGTGFRFGTDLTSITFTTTALKTDYVGLIYNHAAGKCDVVAFVKGL